MKPRQRNSNKAKKKQWNSSVKQESSGAVNAQIYLNSILKSKKEMEECSVSTDLKTVLKHRSSIWSLLVRSLHHV